MSFYKLVFVLLILSFGAKAQQQDTVINLTQVEVKAKRILERQTKNQSTQQIKKAELKKYSTKDLAALLSTNANITINQYGASGLSSVSMRGGNANHTAVLWNGFNIQDPLNGEFNLALATVNLIDEIDINYGGNSALFGSGAVGGSIQLNNRTIYNSKLKLGFQQSIGSFGKTTSLANISYGSKKLFLRTRIFYSKIENNFEYANYAKKNHPIDTLKNSEVEQYGILQEVGYIINKRNKLSSQFWYQDNSRGIAPNMTVSDGYAKQYDDFFRAAIAYNRKGDKLDLEIRNGIFFTNLNFIKPEINIDAHHKSFNNITEVIAKYKFSKSNSALFGLNNNYIKAESDNFSQTESLNKTAAFLSYKFNLYHKFNFTANLRAELVETLVKPPTYGIEAEYFFTYNFSINSKISKNYRTPNFNDLYWTGAYAKGNPKLKDESGYSTDLGINYIINKKKLLFKINITTYYNQFSNLIQWVPEGNIWTPENKKLVETKGIELRISNKYKINDNLSSFINLNYTYTDSRLIEKADHESDNVLNKQLIYIPFYQANGLIGIQYKKFRTDISVKYVGQRYTTADNNNWLDKYIITDISLDYANNYKSYKYNIFFKANNIFNTEYMIREWYPTPLINYELGFKLNYN